MNTRNIFAYFLSFLVLIITVLSLLAIWGVIPWQYIERYIGKTFQSIVVIVVSAIAVYLIQQLLMKNEQKSKDQQVNS